MTQSDEPPVHTINDVLHVVSACSGFSVGQLLMQDRRQPLAAVRQVAMLLARECFPDISHENIGKNFNDRDRKTIMHGVRASRERIRGSAVRFNEIRDLYRRAKEVIGPC